MKKKIKEWYPDHTWEEIMQRFEELAKTPIPYPCWMLLKTRDGSYTALQSNEATPYFTYSIGNFECRVDLWLMPITHRFWREGHIIHRFNHSSKTSKEFACNCLNAWEIFLETDGIEKKYKDLLEFISFTTGDFLK